jgi:hypothetical protein
MQGEEHFGIPPDAAPLPPEAIANIVKDALNVIETAVLANPNEFKEYEWRQRPSVIRQAAIDAYVNPPPPWGLRISLSTLYVGPEHCRAVAKSMLLCKTVTSLDLSMCDMQTDAAIYLFKCLSGRNNVLRHLNISGNFIDAAGGVEAASVVGQLESLHLACNNIGDEGCIAIAQKLRRTNTMKFLNVRANGISDVGIYHLLQALEPLEAMTIDISELNNNEGGQGVPGANALTSSKSEVVPPTTATMQLMSSSVRAAGAARKSSVSPLTGVMRRGSRLYSTAIMVGLPATAAGASQSPTFVDPSVKNTSINALWFQLNSSTSRILSDRITAILQARFPQPPEGFNDKKKKGKKGRK